MSLRESVIQMILEATAPRLAPWEVEELADRIIAEMQERIVG
jgi:hypothetical protein